MARLTTYLNDNSISGEDRLVGSNYLGVDNYQTNNFKIKDLTEYIQGQISVSPSNSTLKANGGIVSELINGTNSLAVDLSATNITGQLANSDLANSSITINGTAVSLGGTITIGEVTEVTAGTYLSGGGTEGTVTLNHDATSRADTTSVAAPGYAASFTVIDTLTTNATGHVTAANVKTVTIPASDNTAYTIEAIDSTNDSIIRLVGTDSTTDDVKLIAGSNITLSTSEANDTITIASQAFGTVFTVATESAMIAATTTGGDIVIRTDVSKTFIHNGGSAGTVADFSELQFSGINTLALSAGDGIDLSRTTVTNTNNDVTVTNTLATASERGGVKIGYTTDASNRNYAIQLDSEKMYVNVPWTDANDNTFRTIEVDSNGDGSANATLGATETLKFKKGTNITLAEDAGEITISSANTEYDVVDSSAPGLAPQLPASHGGKFLKADGTYEVPAYIANTDTQLTTEEVQDIIGNSNFISGSGATTVTYDDTNNTLVISSTDNNDNDNTQNTTELSFVAENDEQNPPQATGNIILRNTITGASSSTDDIKLYAGSNITLTRNDEHKITIASSDTNTTNWNFAVDTGTDENISSGETVTFTGGDRITLAQNGKTIDIAGDILTLTDLNTVTSAMTGDDTLTFGDTGDDTSVVIRGSLQVTGTTTTNNVETVSTSNGVVFEGTAVNEHELTLLADTLDADRTVTIPNATFTIPTQDTWDANAVTVAGYVAAPAATDANLVWKTDANGNPAWRADADAQLSDAEVITAIINSNGISAANKTTIRTNIGAGTSSLTLGNTETTALAGNTSLFDGNYNSLSNKPTIPSGNAIIDWSVSQSGNTPAVINTDNYSNTQLSNAQVVAAIVASTSIDGTDKTTFRSNIGAGTSSFDGNYDNLSNKPTLLALGSTSTTALAGDTALFSGDYDDLSNKPTTISTTQAANIVTNNAKVSDTGVPAIKSDGNNPSLNTNITAAEIRTLIGAGTSSSDDTGTPAILSNGNAPSLNTNITAAEIRTLIGAGTGNGTLTAEADTLATVTGRGASTSTDTTFNSHLTMGGTGHYLYAISNAANVSPTNAHGLAFSWNRSGGSRESNIIFAPGSDANSTHEANAQIRFAYKAVDGTISTAAKLWSGGNFNTAGYITVQNGGNTITNTKVGQWSTAYGWGDHSQAGYLTSSSTQSKYLRSDVDDTSAGDLTVVSYKFNGNASNPTNTTATIYDQASHGPTISGLGVCFRTGTTPSQTGKLNSSGTFTVSGDVIAYGSPSDISLKENIKPIENALDKVEKLQGVTFDWKEKQEDILNIKEDIGFIAQDVQKVLPELVRENENGKLSLRHQGVIPVLLEAIKELSDKIKVLENGSTN